MIAALLIYKSVVTQRKHEGLCANRGYVLAKSKWGNSNRSFEFPTEFSRSSSSHAFGEMPSPFQA